MNSRAKINPVRKKGKVTNRYTSRKQTSWNTGCPAIAS